MRNSASCPTPLNNCTRLFLFGRTTTVPLRVAVLVGVTLMLVGAFLRATNANAETSGKSSSAIPPLPHSSATEIVNPNASGAEPAEPTVREKDSLDDPLLSQPQIPEYGKLPIPQHSERRARSQNRENLPPPARPDRAAYRSHSYTSVHHYSQYGRQMPIPGRPSRNLKPLGQDPSAGEDEKSSKELSENPESTDESEDTEDFSESSSEVTEGEEEQAGLFPGLLHEWNGVSAEYIYTGGLFTQGSGGFEKAQTTRYRGNFDLVLNFDSSGMGLYEGGRLFLYAHSLHGRTLTANEVGDFQLYDNLDGAPRPDDITQISEIWYQHDFADHRWTTKIGKQDANANFALTDLGGEFVHSSFGIPPTVPLPSFPSPVLGGSLFYQPNPHFAIGAGVFDGTPPDLLSKLDSLGSAGAMCLLQFQFTPQLGVYRDFPSTVRIGLFHHSGDWSDPSGGPATYGYNHGVWGTLDQMIWREHEGDPDDMQGVGLFAQYGWSPSDRNTAHEYFGGGLIARGPIPMRDDDVFGVGIANLHFSQLLRPTQTQETAVEVFYKYFISPFVMVQPTVMYIANPNGELPDAVVLGARFEIVF